MAICYIYRNLPMSKSIDSFIVRLIYEVNERFDIFRTEVFSSRSLITITIIISSSISFFFLCRRVLRWVWLTIDHKQPFPIKSSLYIRVCVCTCLRDHSPSRDFVVESITTWSEQTFEAQRKKCRIKERESVREILLPPFISLPICSLVRTQTETSKTIRTIYIYWQMQVNAYTSTRTRLKLIVMS